MEKNRVTELYIYIRENILLQVNWQQCCIIEFKTIQSHRSLLALEKNKSLSEKMADGNLGRFGCIILLRRGLDKSQLDPKRP